MQENQKLDTIYSAIKSSLWEQAKGSLFAAVAASGSIHSENKDEIDRWQIFRSAVDDFIKYVEDHELQI